jgi:hypothetical protein
MHAQLFLCALLFGVDCANVLARPGSPTPSPMPQLSDIGKSWPDRRPLGRVIFAQVANISDTNLNGWNNGGPDAIGVSAFQQNILSLVNAAIANVISMHGQGVIIWDITGCGKTTPALWNESYLGDPRFLDPTSAGLTVSTTFRPYVPPTSPLGLNGIEPAMNAIADQVFASIRSADLKAGICLRAEKVYVNTTGDLDGQQGAYGDDQPIYGTTLNQLADLDAKLTYAYKRWGCRIFYVDSNACAQDIMLSQQNQLNPTESPAWIYTQLYLRHPDCVIFPEEHYNTSCTFAGPPVINDPPYQYERVASRYTELDYQWQSPFLQSDELAAVPDAFTLISVSNIGSSDPADSTNVIAALQNNRCILMANAWYDDPGIMLLNNWQVQAHVNGF